VSLSDLPPLRDEIRAAGLRADKALGQNFLLDGNLLAAIVRHVPLQPGDVAYEVGPGPGGLTRALLTAGARVVAVERDARALPILERLRDASGGALTVIHGDALRTDARAEARDGAHIVANLPYNIATPLLTGWLELDEWPPWWSSLTLMFQREVAERIVAAPGSAAYGRLAVLAGWRTRARIVMTLPAAAFTPPPKVESAVVQLLPVQPADGLAPAELSRLTAAAFGQRRKMLRAALRGLPGAAAALDAAGIDGARRAETLSVAEFVALALALRGAA
jgi:16S rRNA (adenine1518-N6/adenine1519-N6)-dimethyltransferase